MKIAFYAGNVFLIILIIICIWLVFTLLNSKSGYAGAAQAQGMGVLLFSVCAFVAVVIGIIISWLSIRSEMDVLPRILLAIYLSPVIILVIGFIIKSVSDFQTDKRDELEQAVESGNINNASKFLESGMSPNTENDTDFNYNSLLQVAANNGDVAMMQILINAKAKNIKDSLSFAIDSNSLDAVNLLLKNGVDPNFIYRGQTQLSHVSTLKIAKTLVAAGADPQATNSSNKTSLMYSVNNGHNEIVDYLLSQNISVGAIDDTGNNALHYANFDEDNIIALLLNKGISCKIKNKDGLLPLHSIWESKYGWDDKISQNSNSIALSTKPRSGMQSLVKCTGGIDIKGNDGETILMWKAKSEFYEEVFDFLMELGADINAIDSLGQSPLFHIPLERNKGIKTLDYLLTHGAKINQTNAQGNTILHIAAGLYQTDKIITRLLTDKSNPNLKNKAGLSPLINLVKNGDLNVSSLTAFIEANVDLSITDLHGNIPFSIALSERKDIDKDVLKLFINAGKSKINNILNHKGESTLMLAAQNDHFYVVKDLLNKNISATTIDHAGNNVFHHLAMNTSLSHRNVEDFFNILLKASARIDLKNKKGKTPYDLAVNNKHEKFVLDFFQK